MTVSELKRALPQKKRHEPIRKSRPVGKRGKKGNHLKARENRWAVESAGKHVTNESTGKHEKLMNEHRKRAARKNMKPPEPNQNWSQSDWPRTYGMILFQPIM